ncbi:MAG: CDGSH iron-sulfur domain-containing protein [Anaerolineae bacterium]
MPASTAAPDEAPEAASEGRRVKVCENGPYVVSGSVPMAKQVISVDSDNQCHDWQEGEAYPTQERYALCRCGQSKTKPFCDGTHARVGFRGDEEASREPYLVQAKRLEGPGLDLTDAKKLCAHARFCHRAGGAWALTEHSDDPEAKRIAIEEACCCPGGRLVAWEKEGEAIEPTPEPSIGLVEDPQAGVSGPIWLRGGITVEAADGSEYERRNRVALCRCGRSANKPFCDGSHIEAHFNDGDERLKK